MQLEDMGAQSMFWRKLNDVMFKHYGIKPNFKCVMVNSAQANQNVVKMNQIIYNIGDPIVKMVDKERTCLFH